MSSSSPATAPAATNSSPRTGSGMGSWAAMHLPAWRQARCGRHRTRWLAAWSDLVRPFAHDSCGLPACLAPPARTGWSFSAHRDDPACVASVARQVTAWSTRTGCVARCPSDRVPAPPRVDDRTTPPPGAGGWFAARTDLAPSVLMCHTLVPRRIPVFRLFASARLRMCAHHTPVPELNPPFKITAIP